MKEIVKESCRVIEQALDKFKRPAVLWSGGKDSMVLLHLIKFQLFHNLPCICFKEPWFPEKQAFANSVIQDWQLEVWDWAPSHVKLCSGNGRIDVLNSYQINMPGITAPDFITLARGTEKPEKNQPYLCGVETFLSRPLGTFNFPWDSLFHGHKSCDVDPTSGEMPLRTDIMQNPLSASAIFPLRHWTDDDIFDYIHGHQIPYDKTRYDVEKHKVLPNTRYNPDYYHACFACCDKKGPEFVRCPKYNVVMNNNPKAVEWFEPSARYCSLRDSKKSETHAFCQ
jgi:hypothetical protein